jgi:hypothetical protein
MTLEWNMSLLDKFSFWRNANISVGRQYPHDYIGDIDDTLRFLPRPADLFLYFLGFTVCCYIEGRPT